MSSYYIKQSFVAVSSVQQCTQILALLINVLFCSSLVLFTVKGVGAKVGHTRVRLFLRWKKCHSLHLPTTHLRGQKTGNMAKKEREPIKPVFAFFAFLIVT